MQFMASLPKMCMLQSQILERVKPDRVTASKPEEDRRRRTIIVEKKNGSFGFTLQSYGIHYKKEQEIEMITYVDYVDYDGAAFRAGMREGDVILSINGHDMEKADHKTLVNFIKNCDSRMRMVVLFEDCVRKVELHMRYIQLQHVLQGKMAELERLCLRERELLQGKWKTHSLPARKKSTASTSTDATTPTQAEGNDYSYCRPTVSTEDVARVQHQPQTQQLLLAYQYLDPRYRAYMLQPSTSSSGEYFVSWPTAHGSQQQQHGHNDATSHHQSSVTKTSCEAPTRHGSSKGYHQTNGVAAAGPGVSSKSSKGSGNNNSSKNQQQHHHQQQQQQSSHSHNLCNPCVQASNQDSSSLEAYDLASPCCDPHCVPSARRRSRHHKEHRNGHKNTSKNHSDSKGSKEKSTRSSSQPAVHPAASSVVPQPPQPRAHRYFNFGTGLVSQCSLHSCTSSELSCTMPGGAGGESSAASYTTSLSTDTLYWDPSCEGPVATRNHSSKSTTKQGNSGLYHQHHQYPSTSQQQGTNFASYNPAKPAKSWDNLTTKAFGGYGFGYGYLDTTSVKGVNAGKGSHNRTHSTKAGSSSQQCRSGDRRLQGMTSTMVNLYGHGQHHLHYVQPTKSTESLLLLPKYAVDPTLSDSSLSCDCLDVTSPVADSSVHASRFFPASSPNVSSAVESNHGNMYHQQQNLQNKASQTDNKKSTQNGGAEITRL
ncbi:transcriptional regulator EFH1 isoform X3 [Cryptotermes secundus]|uniref:transcriptional regulator EFH1 isoform X3 n=1 Tax=Cryptotermes secundus TaxID=105785 RepID=UPI000CD7DB59|nr:transcriptional regulator EFH1 isoform X3 [Cryptotermes secundus]